MMNNYMAMRVTPEKAFERYLLIKQGKENQLYSLQTVLKIKREHPENWREIMAMDAYGLKGGGKSFERHVLRPVLKGGPIAALGVVCPAVAPAAFGAGFAVAVHEATGGRTPIIAGIDHRGNIAVGPSYNSVAYQQKQQRKMQDKLEESLQNAVKKSQTSVLLIKNKQNKVNTQ